MRDDVKQFICCVCNDTIKEKEVYTDYSEDVFCIDCIPKCKYCSEMEDNCLCNSDNTERFV